jgi:hypothetical protein
MTKHLKKVEMRNAYKILVRKAEAKILLGRLRCRWEYTEINRRTWKRGRGLDSVDPR